MERECPICKVYKNISEYDKSNQRLDGTFSMCKICRSNYNKKRYKLKGYSPKRKFGQSIIDNLKKIGCSFCNEKEICCIQFHHKNRNEKENMVSRFLSDQDKMIKEMQKCMLVCSNCHKKIHVNIIDDNNIPTLSVDIIEAVIKKLTDEGLSVGIRQFKSKIVLPKLN
jgi:hypothetical protein